QMLQKELRRANERHKRLGSHDELTGLANRRYIVEQSVRELARSRRHDFAMSLAILDIDHFREINNNVGHLVGDAILTELGGILQQELRTPDVVARLNGGKFGALLPQTDQDRALHACERLLSAVRAHAFAGHRAGEISIAVGVACYP